MTDSKKINDGGPAFPGDVMTGVNNRGEVWKRMPGMSLRDYLAGQALVGLIGKLKENPAMNVHWPHVANVAYFAADAMLVAREKPDE